MTDLHILAAMAVLWLCASVFLAAAFVVEAKRDGIHRLNWLEWALVAVIVIGGPVSVVWLWWDDRRDAKRRA